MFWLNLRFEMIQLKMMSKKLWIFIREIFLEIFAWLAFLALLGFVAYLLGGCDGVLAGALMC